MRKTCLDMVYQLAQRDKRVFFIGSDLGYKTLDAFKQEMPDRFFMEGIGEANIVGMAAGLAMEGKIPYINTISSFITRRCFEQIVIDLCLHNINVRLIGNGGGMVYAPLGPTHMTTEDLAVMRSIPNMTVLAPADADEMKRLMPATLNHEGPIYIRLAKGYDPVVTKGTDSFKIGKTFSLRHGHDALIITTGITAGPALKASENLSSEGIGAAVLHIPTIKPLDAGTIRTHVAGVGVIVTVEEHSIIGGLGSAIAEIIAETDFRTPKKFSRIGIPDTFPDEYGSQATLLERYAITSENITDRIKSLLKRQTDIGV